MPFNDECLEICGGDEELYHIVANKLQTKLFDPIEKIPCKHENIERFPNNEGYCTDCGLNIKNVDEFRKLTHNSTKEECTHKNRYIDSNGLHICSDCNAELEYFDDSPEWRFYRGSDNKTSKDPSRCHKGKSPGKSLSKDFEEYKLDVPKAIKALVESKYNFIVGVTTVRGKGRLSIIAACLFYTYMEFGEFRTASYIRDLFKLSQKNMSNGLKKYCEKIPKARKTCIKPENLLRWILTLTGVEQKYYRRIALISKYLENTSQLLERSSPQSVASATVYFYLCLNPEYKEELGLTKTKFSEKALLSDITVSKLVKEASSISKCIVNL